MGEGAGDRDEVDRSEGFFGDGSVKKFPGVWAEFGFEFFEPLEVVEALSMGAGPDESGFEPGWFWGEFGVVGERY